METIHHMGPDPRYPPQMGVLAPIANTSSRACMTEYQEGVAGGVTQSCECSLFAVGRCSDCGRPRCGRHGANFPKRGDRFLCFDCAQRLDDADAAEAARAGAARAAAANKKAREAASQRIEQAKPRLMATTDPVERMLRLWQLLNGRQLDGALTHGRNELKALATALSAGARDLPLQLDVDALNWRLHPAALMDWVARRARVRPHRYRTYKHVRTKSKRDGTLVGWIVGSESRSAEAGSYRMSHWTVDIVLLSDGTVAEPRSGKRRVEAYQPRAPITVDQLSYVAKLVGVG